MVYTEYTKMAAVSHGTSHVTTKQCSTLVDIFKNAIKSWSLIENQHASTVSLLESGE